MLELIPKFPAYVVGASASGKVTTKDYENVLISAVDSRLKQYSKINIFYHLGPKFSGFSIGAIWDDAKLAIDHYKSWNKIAIVTDKTWIKLASDVFQFAIPCQLKVFSNKKYDKAEVWITT